MTVLAITAFGRSAVPAKSSPIFITFIAVPATPRRAIARAAWIAWRRAFGAREMTAATRMSTPSAEGMSAVMLLASDAK